MKRGVMVCVAIIVALATTPGALAQAQGGGQGGREGRQGGRGRGPAAPACTNIACDVQADWARSAQLLTGIADAMPEDKWSFKPTPAQRTFAEQVMHIVTTDAFLLGALGAKTPAPPINKAASTKADVMAQLKQSMAYGEAVIKEFDEQGLLERVPGLFMGPTASRLRIISFSIAHSQDIYGQMAVYLRLNGVTPPASNRP